MLLITLLLFIEARRYQYYQLWSSRIRLMEADFYYRDAGPPLQTTLGLGGRVFLKICFSRIVIALIGRRSVDVCAGITSGFI
jgi:hypothetical protein